jgi:type IV secretory pathway VirJ component
VQKIVGPALLCFYGDDDKTESLCTALAPPAQVFRVDGGHHFGGDYDGLAEKILGAIP